MGPMGNNRLFWDIPGGYEKSSVDGPANIQRTL